MYKNCLTAFLWSDIWDEWKKKNKLTDDILHGRSLRQKKKRFAAVYSRVFGWRPIWIVFILFPLICVVSVAAINRVTWLIHHPPGVSRDARMGSKDNRQFGRTSTGEPRSLVRTDHGRATFRNVNENLHAADVFSRRLEHRVSYSRTSSVRCTSRDPWK